MKSFCIEKSLHFLISLFAVSFFALLMPYSAAADDSESVRTVITIENARSTLYEKDKITGDDCIILSGNVKISVAKGSTKNVISADNVKYNRVTEMMYAEGNVSLEQTSADSGGETVTATSLMFNTSTLEGFFDDGRVVQTKSNALNLPSGSTLIVASDIFGRSDSNTIAFKDGSLSFCDDEDPHWHINASRIWLLPGGEFAFLNALLYVGVIPVMYFPAFYYPKDELIFNPVFGYRQREGYFIQTTGYLYGRKPLDTTKSTTASSDSSDSTEKLKALFNFIKPSTLKNQKIEGLMLHNLDTDYKGDTTNYLKVMGDWYSNLGAMVGIDGVFKPKKYVTNIELMAKLGFSKTLFRNGSEYLPYSSSGKTYSDSSNLLGLELPFRYSAGIKFAMSKPLTLNLSMPLYSDPFFNDDFSERTETMDWISFLTESASNSDETTNTVNEVSSFSWTLNSSYSVPLPSFIKPYISTFSMSLNSSVVFSSMINTTISGNSADTDAWKSYTPQRKFYYPSQITPTTFSGTFSGTLFEWSSANRKASSKTPSVKFDTPLAVPEELQTEKDKKAAESQDSKENTPEKKEIAAESGEKEDLVPPSEGLPALAFTPGSVVSIPGIAYSLKYSVKPSFTSQLAYSSTALTKPEDFEWDNLRSAMYTLKIPVTVDNSFSYGGSFFSISNSNTFNPVFQKHPYISTDTATGGYTETAAAALKKTDYTAEKRDLASTNSVSFKPFYYISNIKDSGITWRSTVKIIRTNFIGDAENPEWEYLTTDWSDADSITVNALDFTFAANQLSNRFTQSLTLSTTLPPQPDQYYGTLKFGFPYVSFTFESGVKQKSSSDDTWVKQPIKQNFTLSMFNNTLKLSESYNYNLEDDHHDSFKLALSWKGLQAAYTMSYTTGYDFDSVSGWVARSGQEFLPYSFSLAYAPSSKNIYTWSNRISLNLGLSTSVVADLLRPTNSYFLFAPSISFKINDFLTFTFSSSSRNSVLYRYFQKWGGNEGRIPGEDNIFKDLLNSFRFDDENLRKSSGFKLKSMKFEITHDLHDWDFKASFKLEPRLVTESNKTPYYDFNPYMTISILWRPMSSMKTEIVDNYGKWKLN